MRESLRRHLGLLSLSEPGRIEYSAGRPPDKQKRELEWSISGGSVVLYSGASHATIVVATAKNRFDSTENKSGAVEYIARLLEIMQDKFDAVG